VQDLLAINRQQARQHALGQAGALEEMVSELGIGLSSEAAG
jgi:hypothetical protein